MKNSRAERRAEKDKKKKKAREIFPDMKCPEKMADHLKNCSCEMCCNKRQSSWNSGEYKLTIQERKANEAFKSNSDW